MRNHRIHLVVPYATYEDLREFARRKHLTLSAFIRQVLMDYMQRESERPAA